MYNKPEVSQVAAVWVAGVDNGELDHRDIEVQTHTNHCRKIEYYYGCYDPLQYPLMFPHGELGRNQGILKKGENVYKKRGRPTTKSASLIVVRTKRRIKTLNLSHQRILRIQAPEDIRKEILQGLVDAMGNGETQASNVGQRIVLPLKLYRWNLTANAARPNPQGSDHYGTIPVTRTIVLANLEVNINGKLRYIVNQVYPNSWSAILVYLDNKGLWNMRLQFVVFDMVSYSFRDTGTGIPGGYFYIPKSSR
ncbi:hypothetical protein Tco_0408129 [Tanacetum coccineum]